MMQPTVKTNKHYVQYPIEEILAGSGRNIPLVVVEQNPDRSTAEEVDVGSKISAIFIELWILANSTQGGSTTVVVEKTQVGIAGVGFANLAQLHNYDNKKNIFFASEGLLAQEDANPTPFLRQWIKIPKSKQRFGLGDGLSISISSQATNVKFCGLSTYKDQN